MQTKVLRLHDHTSSHLEDEAVLLPENENSWIQSTLCISNNFQWIHKKRAYCYCKLSLGQEKCIMHQLVVLCLQLFVCLFFFFSKYQIKHSKISLSGPVFPVFHLLCGWLHWLSNNQDYVILQEMFSRNR